MSQYLSAASGLPGGTVVRGAIECIEHGCVVGWALDVAAPVQAITVQVRADGVVLGEGPANRFQQRLLDAGIGAGSHGFRIELSIPFSSGRSLTLELFDADSGEAIAALGYPAFSRNPHCVTPAELDAHGVLGLAPTRPQHRQLARVTRLFSVPVKALRQHRQRSAGPMITPGAAARLQWVVSAGTSAPASIDSFPELVLPHHREPSISIIVPVRNQFHVTWQCLSSVILHAGASRFEVLLVDDASSDATCRIETRVRNLRVLRNPTNLGFLHSCNRAAEMARGEYLVFLNNDTEVTAGWLDALRAGFDTVDHVGACGAKLVYPDGRLQDAGGIVWESGTPWNVGHGGCPQDPRYNYVRDVDYLTGAALMVSHPAWNQVGGFSADYAPAYYEDTDLAFKLREAGFRTLYCPQSTVIHYEGVQSRHLARWRNQAASTAQCGSVRQALEPGVCRSGRGGRGSASAQGPSAFAAGADDRQRVSTTRPGRRQLRRVAGASIDAGSGLQDHLSSFNLQHSGRHVDALQRMGVECVHSPFHRSINKFLERRAAEFDVIYVTRYSVARRILEPVRRFSSAKVIFNNADLHFLRELRGALGKRRHGSRRRQETPRTGAGGHGPGRCGVVVQRDRTSDHRLAPAA